MPRGPRIDAPGFVQHVVVRGIERRPIFVDDEDRRDILDRLDRILAEGSTRCLAWTLIANHVHLVLRTGDVPISRVMSRLGTGYARRFNERHGRVGHLFQNRFLSRIVRDDADLLGVIRYVHLNPLKHGVLHDLDALAADPWCGHGALVGTQEPHGFHDAGAALGAFGADPCSARLALDRWMAEGARATAALGARPSSDPATIEPLQTPSLDGAEERILRALIQATAGALRVGLREIVSGSRVPRVVRARSIVAHRAAVEHGIRIARIAAALGTSESSVRRAIERERWARPARGAEDCPATRATQERPRSR